MAAKKTQTPKITKKAKFVIPARKTNTTPSEGKLPAETTAQAGPATHAKGPKTKIKRHPKTKQVPKEKTMSALDAAAKVLADTGEAMTCMELIEAMAKKGLWTSPGGKTPANTLYAAIAREINVKGKESRFAKADRGKFARKA